jgi:hypothetical protein
MVVGAAIMPACCSAVKITPDQGGSAWSSFAYPVKFCPSSKLPSQKKEPRVAKLFIVYLLL